MSAQGKQKRDRVWMEPCITWDQENEGVEKCSEIKKGKQSWKLNEKLSDGTDNERQKSDGRKEEETFSKEERHKHANN